MHLATVKSPPGPTPRRGRAGRPHGRPLVGAGISAKDEAKVTECSWTDVPDPVDHRPAGDFLSRLLSAHTAQSGGCVTCAATQAFSLFATANAEIMSSLGKTCTEPIGEVVHGYSTHVVFFEGPPGIDGSGSPSGGSYPSNGLVTYFPPGSTGSPSLGSWKESCTMAQTPHATCTAILNLFLEEHENE
jgi:hypothetical protein